MTPCVWRILCLRNSSSVPYFRQPPNLPTAARRNRKCTECGTIAFGRNRMSAESAHLSTFGAETEAEIRSTSNVDIVTVGLCLRLQSITRSVNVSVLRICENLETSRDGGWWMWQSEWVSYQAAGAVLLNDIPQHYKSVLYGRDSQTWTQWVRQWRPQTMTRTASNMFFEIRYDREFAVSLVIS